MPVKFTNSALAQMLLGRSNVVALGKILDDLLPNPTSLKNPCLGITKTPFQIGNETIVSRLLTKVVRVLEINLFVGTP